VIRAAAITYYESVMRGDGSSRYYPGTEEAHTNPTRQQGECLRALAGASG
jgi:hypothetical protein